jgi:hypothetical protein
MMTSYDAPFSRIAWPWSLNRGTADVLMVVCEIVDYMAIRALLPARQSRCSAPVDDPAIATRRNAGRRPA